MAVTCLTMHILWKLTSVTSVTLTFLSIIWHVLMTFTLMAEL